MFYRKLFVTNSSSSSYIGWGYRLNQADLDQLTDDQHDELFNMWSEGPYKITFIAPEYSNRVALVCLVEHHTSEDFVSFVDDNLLDKAKMIVALRKVLQEFGIRTEGDPTWVFSYSYG